MATKICVTYSGNLPAEKVEALRNKVADALGVLAVDVIVLRDAAIHTFNVPDELLAKRRPAPADITGTLDATWQSIADRHAEDEAS